MNGHSTQREPPTQGHCLPCHAVHVGLVSRPRWVLTATHEVDVSNLIAGARHTRVQAHNEQGGDDVLVGGGKATATGLVRLLLWKDTGTIEPKRAPPSPPGRPRWPCGSHETRRSCEPTCHGPHCTSTNSHHQLRCRECGRCNMYVCMSFLLRTYAVSIPRPCSGREPSVASASMMAWNWGVSWEAVYTAPCSSMSSRR